MWMIINLVVISVYLTNVQCVQYVEAPHHKEPKECRGTHVGFGFSGGTRFHYRNLKLRYEGCTHVDGNLEITNLESTDDRNYDLSFLSDIEVVTGYVLIGLLNTDVIPLTNLRLICADNTYEIDGDEYGLAVALTADKIETDDENSTATRRGLIELQMPNLREISRGKVFLSQNPLLKFVHTINWNVIVPKIDQPVKYGPNASDNSTEISCDPLCQSESGSHCWGASRFMCQQIVPSPVCDPSCPGRCYSSDILGCCHTECAVGCYGPLNSDCMMCKYFKFDGRCVSECPPLISYADGQDCILMPT